MVQSSIIYRNATNTVFLIDIPSSLAFAQVLSLEQQGPTTPPCISDQPERHTTPTEAGNNGKLTLLSSAPLTEPYGSLTEPKSDAARARVLERIPASERVYQTDVIEPLVRDSLEEIKQGGSGSMEWCRGRIVREEETRLERKRAVSDDEDCFADCSTTVPGHAPPVILSPGPNMFRSMSELRNVVVRNTSPALALLDVRPSHRHVFLVPPASGFVLCTLPLSQTHIQLNDGPLPGLPKHRKFNLILLDPPWPNRSVRRSAHYHTQPHQGMRVLSSRIADILKTHLQDTAPEETSLAAIWITNAAKARRAAYDAVGDAGLTVCEEWVWIKTTTRGEPIAPLDGLWRKPYEILIIARKGGPRPGGGAGAVTRRVIAAVPDVHSRKPNLKEVFERVFFLCPVLGESGLGYSALEVFARNLTAGWWACGDQVLKFNSRDWWVES